METLIAISIFITEILTMIAIGAIFLWFIAPLYDWLKKDNGKRTEQEDHDWVIEFDRIFDERRKRHE